MPPPRPATEACRGSFEPGPISQYPPSSRPAAHSARRPDVCDKRQTASSLNAPRVGHNKQLSNENMISLTELYVGVWMAEDTKQDF